MRVAVRCRLPGTFRQPQDSELPALADHRKHLPRRSGRIPRVVIRLRVPAVGVRARDWLRRRPVPMVAPWPAGCRLAVISPWFRVGAGARVFVQPSLAALRRFAPGAIAAPVAVLRELAGTLIREGGELPSLEYGVLALTGASQEPLSKEDRELFWRAFQAPVFEQRRGERGELVAYECEVHQGLHLAGEEALEELAGWVLLEAPCACGRTAPLVAPPGESQGQAAKSPACRPAAPAVARAAAG